MRRFAPTIGATCRRLSTEVAIKPSLTVVRHPFTPDGAALPSTANPNERFAVVEHSGTQFKVCIEDALTVNSIEADIGETVELDKVLMIGSKAETFLGRPYVEGARVIAVVEEKLRDAKVYIFKKRRRKNKSARLRGFRRQIVKLRINEIVFDSPN